MNGARRNGCHHWCHHSAHAHGLLQLVSRLTLLRALVAPREPATRMPSLPACLAVVSFFHGQMLLSPSLCLMRVQKQFC
jgi:hypothetical protein